MGRDAAGGTYPDSVSVPADELLPCLFTHDDTSLLLHSSSRLNTAVPRNRSSSSTYTLASSTDALGGRIRDASACDRAECFVAAPSQKKTTRCASSFDRDLKFHDMFGCVLL